LTSFHDAMMSFRKYLNLFLLLTCCWLVAPSAFAAHLRADQPPLRQSGAAAAAPLDPAISVDRVAGIAAHAIH
jgi:hypothetical protein